MLTEASRSQKMDRESTVANTLTAVLVTRPLLLKKRQMLRGLERQATQTRRGEFSGTEKGVEGPGLPPTGKRNVVSAVTAEMPLEVLPTR